MSTKSSYLLTDEGEHWYHDCSDETVNIEIKKRNIKSIIYQYDYLVIYIKNESSLYKEVCDIFKIKDWILKIPFKNINRYENVESEYYILLETAKNCDCDYEKKARESYDEIDDYIVGIKEVSQVGEKL